MAESNQPRTFEIEQSLEAQIDPWLRHMEWRSDFAEWRTKRIWQERYQAQALADVAEYAGSVAGGSRILDLGTGMGGFAVAFALQMRGDKPPEPGVKSPLDPVRKPVAEPRTIVALDYNRAYCEIARTRARRYDLDLPALVAAGENLPFPADTFGVLTCRDVVEHVQDPVRLFEEISRVLQPGGLAFVTVINRLALVDPHYHLRFVNWLPRTLGEKYIGWRQRTKRSPLLDRQKLAEMHYFTFGGAARLARMFGMSVHDLNSGRSRFRRLSPPLGGVLYLFWRTFGMGTYSLVLTKATL